MDDWRWMIEGLNQPVLAAIDLIAMLIYALIAAAVSTGIRLLLTKKPKDAKAAGREAFTLPTAQEGRVPPLVSGTREVLGPNAISPILELRAKKKKRSSGLFSKVTVGYYYYITLHLMVCQREIDGIIATEVAKYRVWPLPGVRNYYAADGQTTMTIQAGICFGGTDREGGVSGVADVQYGGDAQTLNSYLEGLLGSAQPAYRGFTGVILKKVYIGFNTPYLKPWSFVCKRLAKHPDGTSMWYAAKASIVLDGDTSRPHLNAIHWLYERIVCPAYGLGKGAGVMGTSWTAAADTCYTEGYGISNIWDSAPDDIESQVQQVEGIVDGKVYQDPITGKYEIGLIRQDYDAGSLEEFDESDFWVEMMATSSPGTVPTETIVMWWDRSSRQSRPARSPDGALRTRQGARRIPQEYDYSGYVCSPTLAATIADREQQQISALPRRLTLRCLRTMAHLHETSVIKITYEALGLASLIVRVVTIDRGGLGEGECVLEVVEDVFGPAYLTSAVPPDAGASPGSETTEDWLLDGEGYSEIVFTTSSTENGPY